MSKSFQGRVVGYSESHVTFQLACGTRKSLRCGADVRRQAISNVGRVVRFQALLSEETETLSSPLFVVGSSAGLARIEPEPAAFAAPAVERAALVAPDAWHYDGPTVPGVRAPRPSSSDLGDQ